LIFSSLHPGTEEGQKALKQAWEILSGISPEIPPDLPHNFSQLVLQLPGLADSHLNTESLPAISQEASLFIEQAAAILPNRKLLGHTATSLQEITALPPEQIDLSRALVLLESPSCPSQTSTESALDLLALELLANLGTNNTPEAKIEAINKLVFHDLGIRYPPLSKAMDEAQRYSELSSVFSSRRGICLGTTVLYICLAQRLGLPLVVYSPPGHVFVGYKGSEKTRVIETTARGIDVPLCEYLGLSLRYVPEKNVKDVIGMVYHNRGSDHLKKGRFTQARACYEQACQFEKDTELDLLIAFCELLSGNSLLSRQLAHIPIPDYRTEQDILLFDLQNGALSPQAGQTFLSSQDLVGDSLSASIANLQKNILLCPESMALRLQLCQCWLSLGKTKEALLILETVALHKDCPPSILYLLTSLYLEREDFPKAWATALHALKLSSPNAPKPLKQLICELQRISPQALPQEVLSVL
jgi:tetratricopeptide (TPR) repeat protein